MIKRLESVSDRSLPLQAVEQRTQSLRSFSGGNVMYQPLFRRSGSVGVAGVYHKSAQPQSSQAMVEVGYVTAPGRTDPLGLDFITETCRTMFSELLARA